MTMWVSKGPGVLCAVGGAALWGVGLAVLHPQPKPTRSWEYVWHAYDSSVARDVRWLGILVTLLGLVLALQGERIDSARCLVGAAGWLGLDLCLDRFGVAGTTAAVPVAAVAVALSLGAAVIVSRVRQPRSTDRRALVLAGVVGAALLPFTADISVPDGLHAQSSPASSVALSLLMGAAVVGCAVAAAPTLDGVRRWLAAGLAVAVVAGPIWIRALSPYEQHWALWTVAVVVVSGVVMLAWDAPLRPLAWFRYPAAAVGALVVYPAVMVLLTTATAPFVLGALLTGLVLGVPMSQGVAAR